MTSLVSVQDVTKDFPLSGGGHYLALRGIDLDIRKGEFISLIGHSGCGKTTLLNILSGLDDFDAGEVSIEGTNLRTMNDRARTAYRAQRMGFIFQTFNLLPVITAVENVELPLLVSGVRPAEARRRADAALAQVGLADRSHHRPAELSGGQRQRVTIARALVNQPAIVWADEPTGNLDTASADEVFALLRRFNHDHGSACLIVTHDATLAGRCDRQIDLVDGRLAPPQPWPVRAR